MQERLVFTVESKDRRDVESLLAVGSAIAWGALALSAWGLLERSRARRVRHQISDRLLGQVFPVGQID